ncbi:hypothetical protein K456DRAFT_40701 [Colletotrichum gloeosporioides 23]|nr:hypothetical protein K456DRAFT_40701 [Colletotrichum gloeosporioides 23]
MTYISSFLGSALFLVSLCPSALGRVAPQNTPLERRVTWEGRPLFVGVHNWEIIEASDRVGGRFRTVFVDDTEEFAEMGPMRLPYHQVTYKSDDSTHAYSDLRMTFQLADLLDRMNESDEKYRIDFIPWIQHHPNELLAFGTGRHPDGRVPTPAEIAKDSSLGAPPVMTSAESLDGSDDTLGETEWKCVDKGFNRVSDAFIPHVSDRLILNRKIRKLEPVHDEAGNSRTRLSWYPGAANRTLESKNYDYTSMAVTFTVTRLGRRSFVISRVWIERIRIRSHHKLSWRRLK